MLKFFSKDTSKINMSASSDDEIKNPYLIGIYISNSHLSKDLDNNFKITHFYEYDFPIKRSYEFHQKKIHRIKVGCWRMEKIN